MLKKVCIGNSEEPHGSSTNKALPPSPFDTAADEEGDKNQVRIVARMPARALSTKAENTNRFGLYELFI